MKNFMNYLALLHLLLVLCTGAALNSPAQSVCENEPPYLGEQQDELCVKITNMGPGQETAYFRGPSPLGIPATLVGEYTIDTLTAILTITQFGMAVSLEGTVTRTNPGTGLLEVQADGGLADVPFGRDFGDMLGDLILNGSSTGMSEVKLGGAVGRLNGGIDITWRSIGNAVIEVNTMGSDTFFDQILDIPTWPRVVAIKNTTTFHLSEVGTSITIPSTAGIGDWTEKNDDNDDDGDDSITKPPSTPPWVWVVLILAMLTSIFYLWYKRRKRPLK